MKPRKKKRKKLEHSDGYDPLKKMYSQLKKMNVDIAYVTLCGLPIAELFLKVDAPNVE
jgi:hypothetical protein